MCLPITTSIFVDWSPWVFVYVFSNVVHKWAEWSCWVFLNYQVRKSPFLPPNWKQSQRFLTAHGIESVSKRTDARSLAQVVTAPLDTFVSLHVWPETSGWDRKSQTSRSWLQADSERYESGEGNPHPETSWTRISIQERQGSNDLALMWIPRRELNKWPLLYTHTINLYKHWSIKLDYTCKVPGTRAGHSQVSCKS